MSAPVRKLAEIAAKAARRRAKARIAQCQTNYGGGSREEFVADILTDLRHFCDRHGIDFHAASDTSCTHYIEERE